MGKKGCNMTPVIFLEGTTALSLKDASKYRTQSKYTEERETKQRPTLHSIDQFFYQSPFIIKNRALFALFVSC